MNRKWLMLMAGQFLSSIHAHDSAFERADEPEEFIEIKQEASKKGCCNPCSLLWLIMKHCLTCGKRGKKRQQLLDPTQGDEITDFVGLGALLSEGTDTMDSEHEGMQVDNQSSEYDS